MQVFLFLIGAAGGFVVFYWGFVYFKACDGGRSDSRKNKPFLWQALEAVFYAPFLAFFNPFPFFAIYLFCMGYKLSLGKLDNSWLWFFLGMAFTFLYSFAKIRRLPAEKYLSKKTKSRKHIREEPPTRFQKSEKVEKPEKPPLSDSVPVKGNEEATEGGLTEVEPRKPPHIIVDRELERHRRYVTDLDLDMLPSVPLQDDFDQLAKEENLRNESLSCVTNSTKYKAFIKKKARADESANQTHSDLKDVLGSLLKSVYDDALAFSQDYSESGMRRQKFAVEYLVLAAFCVHCSVKVAFNDENYLLNLMASVIYSLDPDAGSNNTLCPYLEEFKNIYPRRSEMYLWAIDDEGGPVQGLGKLFAQMCLDGANRKLILLGKHLVSSITEAVSLAVVSTRNN